MPASDFLKKFRSKGYSHSFTDKTNDSDKSKEGMDSGKENSTPRLIALTDDEKKSFAQAKPGDDLACEVHGSLDGDGKFRVMSVSPLQGESYGGGDENQMATQVMQRVMPNVVPSPS